MNQAATDPADRYHRQELLPAIGAPGQARLRSARAVLVGCGALGTVIAESLVRAGVGELVIADRDVVEWTNLQRQVLFDERDAREGAPKAAAAARRLAAVNAGVRIEPAVTDVNHRTIGSLLAGAQVIVDGTDNFETRYLLNDASVSLGIPYVYGGAVGTGGTTTTILPRTEAGRSPWELEGGATACLRCLAETMPPPGSGPTCDTAGVLGPAAGVIALVEAAEAIKVLTRQWAAARRTLLSIELWPWRVRELAVGVARGGAGCVCCGERRFEYLDGRSAAQTTALCGRNAVQVLPSGPDGSVDLRRLADRLGDRATLVGQAVMLRVAVDSGAGPVELTVFPDGRAIVKGTTEPAAARSVYARYVGA